MKMTYVLFSRVLIYRLGFNKLSSQWEKMGFKKVILSDGFRNSWYYNLNPQKIKDIVRSSSIKDGLDKPLRLR
jgi:hypothetical protein